jgi:hypothetical protein
LRSLVKVTIFTMKLTLKWVLRFIIEHPFMVDQKLTNLGNILLICLVGNVHIAASGIPGQSNVIIMQYEHHNEMRHLMKVISCQK